MLSSEEGVKLVQLARHAIETMLFNQPLALEQYKIFDKPQGVFVTLKKEGKLRGQMGTIETKEPLFQAVLKAARDAAFNDRKFDTVTKEEIKEIQIEVALIIQPRLIKVINPEQYSQFIRPETDGLMIMSGVYKAIMLPNPEMRYGWDVERVLRHLCISAGLTMDAWKSMDENIYVFQAQVFGERNGKIIELV